MTPRGLETSLYETVKPFFERQGFEVKGEVCGCDIVPVRDGEPPLLGVTELKLGLSLELVLQGVNRLRAADEVWLAVLATRRGRDRDPRALRLAVGLGSACWPCRLTAQRRRFMPSRFPTVLTATGGGEIAS